MIQCCPPDVNSHPQCYPIQVAADDPFYGGYKEDCLNFVRTAMCPVCKLGKLSFCLIFAIGQGACFERALVALNEDYRSLSQRARKRRPARKKESVVPSLRCSEMPTLQ